MYAPPVLEVIDIPSARLMALYLPAGNPLSHRDVTKRLLIVVDEQGMVALLREFFCHFTRQRVEHERKFEVISAYDVVDALAILRREKFDLILLGVQMPLRAIVEQGRMFKYGLGDNGLGLLKAIRRLGVNTPVIMISDFNDIEKTAEALTEGAFAYVAHPFDLPELDKLVALALDESGPHAASG